MRDIILDTDIGDDIDDAFALALAVAMEAINLRAIVTVYSDVMTRARIAAGLLACAGREDIPVAAGLAKPLKHRPAMNDWVKCQARAIPDGAAFPAITSTPGPEFIAETVLANEDPTTLVGIGPLTNIAMVLQEYPAIRDKVDEIVVMGGLFDGDHAEWNMSLDPEAAAAVFGSGLPVRIVPLDITRTCNMGNELLQDLAGHSGPLQQFLGKMLAGWVERTGQQPVLHDPLTVACLEVPELFTFRGYDVDVNLEPGPSYGVTTGQRNDTSLVQVCEEADLDGFLTFYAEVLLGRAALPQTD